MRGFFGIGAEKIHKPMNLGSLFRSAHAFGANFLFTISATYSRSSVRLSDTSDAFLHVPFYSFPNLNEAVFPDKCDLVGVEFIEDAIDLPSFYHPQRAVYILGPERGALSPDLLEKCNYIIKIPTKFCLNVGLAGAIIMYDRVKSLGNYSRKSVTLPGKPEKLDGQVYGHYADLSNMDKYRDTLPNDKN